MGVGSELVTRWRRFVGAEERELVWPWPSDVFSFLGNQYGFGVNTTMVGNRETPPSGFAGVVGTLFKGNPVVFTNLLNRQFMM